MKDLCAEYNIPTAAYRRLSDAEAAGAFLDTLSPPYVIKADGLAAGKGVIIAQTRAEADQAVADMLAGQFGAAGAQIVIEEFLQGEEASFFALCDGEAVRPLIAAQDHKRIGEGDTGPNTGGMGAYSPAPVFTDALLAQTMEQIIQPTARGMAERGAPYKGVLYAGLMITAEGPKLIEYNARFGDPECQVLMRRLQSDLLPILKACADGALAGAAPLDWSHDTAACVVLAAQGYPGAYEKGSRIRGLDAAAAAPEVEIFHAGTALRDGALTAAGGRVLNVTATGGDLRAALASAYAAAHAIDWPQAYMRRDIGWRAL